MEGELGVGGWVAYRDSSRESNQGVSLGVNVDWCHMPAHGAGQEA